MLKGRQAVIRYSKALELLNALTVAVNANGKIVASHLGAMNESQLQDIINLLIKP